MAIKSCEEIWTGRAGSFGDDLRRTYTRRFRVETDDRTWGPALVCFSGVLPPIWSFYVSFQTGEFDSLALCRRYVPRQDDGDPCLWEVDCEYSTEGPEPALYDPAGNLISGAAGASPGRPGGGGGFDNPDQAPWQVTEETNEYEVPFHMGFTKEEAKDTHKEVLKRKRRVRNIVGDRYTPLPTYLTGEEILTVTRIETTNDRALRRKYRFALNSDKFLDAEPGQAQMLPIRVEHILKGGRVFYQKTYRVRFKEPELLTGDEVAYAEWQPRLLEQGFNHYPLNELTGLGNKDRDPIPITDGHGQPVSEPKLLSADGRALTPARLRDETQIENTTHYAYRYLPFAVFKLNVR